MTPHEAAGIKGDVDIKTGQKLSHSEVYGRIIDRLGGLQEVSKYVPYDVEYLREKIQKDQYLNNTSMGDWDRAAGFQCRQANCLFIGGGIWNLYQKHGINAAGCSTGVCILKEAARRMCVSYPKVQVGDML